MSLTQEQRDAIHWHLRVMFGRLPAQGYVCLRGLGEKGTDAEGVFVEDKFISMEEVGYKMESLAESVAGHVERWNKHGRGSFIVPAILSEPKGKSENVSQFGSLVVDLDSGDIDEKHAGLENVLGKPTAVVFSGGMEEGKAKRHLYWTLMDPCSDIQKAIRVRHEMAVKGGGDMQFGMGVQSNPFGRAHQPVRIAGSLYNKGNAKRPVVIQVSNNVYGIDNLRSKLSMIPAPRPAHMSDEDLFAPERPKLDLDKEIHQGGEDENRWTQFSRVAGFFISAARRGELTMDEAKERCLGWMEAKMVPPWPNHRFEREWASLLSRDVAAHGPMPAPAQPIVKPEEGGLEVWAAHRWSLAPKPSRKFIVDQLVLDGKHQLLVAEGGAGKTFLMLDLAIKVAAWEEGDDLEWCGNKIKSGGSVVVMTTEDDKDELHIRMTDIDPALLRKKAGDKLIVLPTINVGGAFSLVEKDPKTQETRPSRRWNELMSLLRNIKDLRLVVIDTLNSVLHGEENSATVINEFVRVASQISGELGAAVIMTHHVRKAGDEPIRNAKDMRASIRGSSALPSAFRSVIGIWHCSDYDRRLAAMGIQPRQDILWKLAVVKANNPEMMTGEKTLLRDNNGLLHDVTERDRYSSVNMGERHAWLLLAIELAAAAGHPYSIEGKNAKSGLYRRRAELPHALRQVGPNEFGTMVDELLFRKAITAAAARGGREKKWLDVPNGHIARDEAGAELASGAYSPPDWIAWEYDESINSCIRK
jgi:hypothetical protein